MKNGATSDKENADESDLCRVCNVTPFDAQRLVESLDETTRLEFNNQFDLNLNESSLKSIMDTFGETNANEIARQIQEIGPSFTSSVEKCEQLLNSLLDAPTQLNAPIVARILSMMIVTPTSSPTANTPADFYGQTGGGGGVTATGGSTSWNNEIFGAVGAESTIASGKTSCSPVAATDNDFAVDSSVAAGTTTDDAKPSSISSSFLPLLWNGQVFASAVRSLAPNLQWADVVTHLDHAYFYVRSKASLELLTKVLTEGLQEQPFPIETLFKMWNVNKPGQLSWLIQIVQNPDVFYILNHNHRPVNYSCLKVMLDEASAISQWKCLDLVGVLFRLGEINTLTTTVYNLLRAPGPIANCPDLLFLGVVQISISMSQLRLHTLKQLVGQLLPGHANAVSVLSYAWNFDSDDRQVFRQIILNAMAAYYGQNSDDQTRLTRILGIAHELKPNGLSELFNLQQFPFVIDLACLASRRDFLKLDKFLDDKLAQHGETFATSLCQYLRRRCMGPASINIPQETFRYIYTALQSKANFSPAIANELSQLITAIRGTQGMNNNAFDFRPPFYNLGGNVGNALPPQQSLQQRSITLGTAIGTSSSIAATSTENPIENLENMIFSEDVQEQANLYFQQIYSPTGRMSVQEFIAKLKAFRDSVGQKEKDILMCVVKNLFDEYKFFHDYPERELKTTAEVYGGLIREGILAGLHFANAVRKVIEAVQSDPQKSLWRFGVLALNACCPVLFRYPKICQIIISNNSFNKFPMPLREYLTRGAAGALPSAQFVTQQDAAAGNNNMWNPYQVQQMSAAIRAATPTTIMPSSVVGSMLGCGGGAGTPTAGTPTSGPHGGVISGVLPQPIAATNPSNMKFALRGLTTGGASILNVTNVDTLINATERDGTYVKQPDQAIYDRVSFLCNNLSQTNLLRKTEEMKEIIAQCGVEFLEWLAQYMVMKRVTVEQNFQPLYNNFLMSISEEKLDEFVQKETYRNVDILLRSDKRQAVANFGDRQLLKNLGHWLGVITIGRDKPILAKDLDLKLLLLEAFYKGQQELLYVVPFVVKTLSSSSKSTIFGPRCAWIYGIVKVLVEIHNEPDLKLNLKFEIEVLCKVLSIDLEEVKVGNFLKEASRLPKLVPMKPDGTSPMPQRQLRLGNSALMPPGEVSADFTSQTASVLAAGFSTDTSSTIPASSGNQSIITPTIDEMIAANHQKQQQAQQPQDVNIVVEAKSQAPPAPSNFHYNDINIYNSDGLSQHLKDPSHLPLFQHNPRLKVLCKTAIVQSIREIIGGITDRSINVAITVTEHICRKDFALDPEEDHMRRAAHQMMRSMTSGMAAITCREPLASTILAYLKQALYNHLGPASATNPDQVKMVEEAAFAVTEANLEVATNFIVKSSCEKAIAEVERRLEMEFLGRRTARKEGRVFQPAHTEVLAMCEKVPEPIRMKPGPISQQGIKIYDDYSSKICGFKPLATEDLINEFAHRHASVTPIANAGNIMMTGPGTVNNGNNALAMAAAANKARNAGFPVFLNGQQQMERMRADSAVPGGANVSGFPPPPPMRPPTALGTILPQQQNAVSQFPSQFINQQQQQQNVLQTSMLGGLGGSVAAVAANLSDLNPQKDETEAILHLKVESILREWMTLCYTPVAQRDPQCAFAMISRMMHQSNLLSTDEKITKFFKICANFCLEVSHRLLKNENGQQSTVVRQRCYHTLDAFVKLTCLMVKYSEGAHPVPRVALLKKVLGILSQAIYLDHESRKHEFNGMPFHRILIIMFNELTAPNPSLDPISWSILEAFGQILFILQPRRMPGFAFHWLDIIGHRNFIGRLLSDRVDRTKTSAMYTQLILSHLKFLAPFLRNMDLNKSMTFIYKGTLRVLLVILHDFPEILCEYHYVMCDVIPANCVQLRNLVLSAYPRDMRLPDPFTQSLSVIENLPEMRTNPKVHREMSNIISSDLKARLDDYLSTRAPVNFLSDLPGMLQISQTPGSRYNVSVVNAIVMYVGVRAIDAIHERGQRISIETIAHSAYMDIFQNLAVSMCTEGRYLLFNAIANQLRYPNSLTHYFSCTLLYLFLEANAEVIQEQITRILFERLVALRPHPWGLLITFIELIRNRRYNFWEHDFVRCAPEIERLFTSVASSCSVQQSLTDDASMTAITMNSP